MGWRFRQSFTIIPGLRLNLSKTGLSASIGGAPFTLNVGQHGVMGTASIPGTGLSYREHFGTTPRSSPSNDGGILTPSLVLPPPLPPDLGFINTAPVEQIHSASTELLTSATLTDLKHLIKTAFLQREEIVLELGDARNKKITAVSRYESWHKGFLFKRLFKTAFTKRKQVSETATDKVAELEEQLRLSTISTYIEVEKEQGDFYYRMKDEFAALCDCASIWDVKSHQATDKFHERTTASVSVGRQKVKFAVSGCDLIEWEQSVPHILNSKGGDFFLYPGFILYRAAREAFSLIEYHDVSGIAKMLSFYEEEGVPSDSAVIGHTWAKANKDGTRDKRFADNHEIPIVQYGLVTLKSDNGLWEEFHFSNPQKLFNFLNALNAFTGSFAAVAK
jgi:uncharacterized protein DUF4236